jgi:hypothetical protein
MKYISRWFSQPTLLEKATQELTEAMIAKLNAESAVDFAQSVVDYNTARITRLETYLKGRK